MLHVLYSFAVDYLEAQGHVFFVELLGEPLHVVVLKVWWFLSYRYLGGGTYNAFSRPCIRLIRLHRLRLEHLTLLDYGRVILRNYRRLTRFVNKIHQV